jgi:antitoxin component YwqK of YwqJK toxin-antitoxin module/Tfp pilus assembly protein PilF
MKSRNFLLGILFFLTSTIGFSQKPKMLPLINSGEIITEAVKAHDEENYAKAVELYSSIPKNDTNYSYALSELALTYIAMSDSVDAIRVCKEGIALNDRYNIRYYQLLGNAYHMADSIDKAIQTYKKGIELYPYTYKFWYELAVLYSAINKDSASIACYQKAIRLNPLNAASHYYLGNLAAKNNKFTQAILSLSFYALIDNNSKRALKALSVIESIAKGQLEIDKDSIIDFSYGNDRFDEIEELIRSKAAINEKYKTDVKLAYTDIVKTIQMVNEKLTYSPGDTGFWMQTYVPFFNEMWKKKMFAPMMYSSFAAVEDQAVKKLVKSNESDIKDMAEVAINFIRNNMKHDTYVIQGKKYTGYPTTYNDGSSKSIGNTDPVTKNAIGDWAYFYEGGILKSYGTFDKNGETQGEWNYYYPNGKYKKKLTWANSKLTGPYEEYFENGVLKEKGSYKDGISDGPVAIYFETGLQSITATYNMGKLNGPVKLYYQNGMLKREYISKNDQIDGSYKEYFFNGNLKEESTYVNGKENGLRTEYHSTGEIRTKTKVTNGLFVGEQTFYHKNGKIAMQGVLKEGYKDGLWKSFSEDGVLTEEYNFENGNQIGVQKEYDTDGKILNDKLYTKTEIKKYKYFDKAGNVVSQGEAKGGDLDFTSYYPDGKTKSAQLSIRDKLIEGKAIYYFPNGVMKSEFTYEKGEKNGPGKSYFKNGNLQKELTYKNDLADGYYIEYNIHGGLVKEGWYVDDEIQGRWLDYNSNGTISQDEYYLNGNELGVQTYYDDLGTKSNELTYDEQTLFTKIVEFDTLGKVINTVELAKGAGEFVTVNLDKSVYQKVTYKNGYKDGEDKFLYPNGKTYMIKNYKKGMLNGETKTYFYNGKLRSVAKYINDELDSVSTSYSEDGIISTAVTYKDGEMNGKSVYYYDDGKVLREGNYKDDEREGDFIYYAQDGKTVRFKMKYKNGFPVSYSYLGKDNQYVPDIPVGSGHVKVVAYYPNGNKSAEFEMQNSVYDGVRKYYFPSGKIESESVFKNDDFDGPYKEYFENGKVQSEMTYVRDEINGLSKTYNQQGVLIEQSNYVLDSREGDSIKYDPVTGKVVKKIKYIRNFPYEKI